jgi:hypothetical protein
MRIRNISILLASILAMVVAGAGGCSSQKGERFTYQNQGRLCLFPEGEPNLHPGWDFDATTPRDYLADQPVNVVVELTGCLSGSCTFDRTASCSVERTGADVRVTSEGSFGATGATTCTIDCQILAAGCIAPVLAAGSYTFRHGDLNLPIQIPSSVPPPCVGSSGRAPYTSN